MAAPPQARPNTAQHAERDARIFRLRLAGLTVRQIAAEVGLGPTRVQEIITEAVRDLVEPEVEELRKVAAARLDDQRRTAHAVRGRPHYIVQSGKIIKDEQGRPLIDDGPVLAANEQLRKIDEREARLYGLDPKEPLEITLQARGDLTANAIETVINALQLAPERRVFALEAAAAALDGSPLPPAPEPEEKPEAPSMPWPLKSDGVEYVVIGGVRYVKEGPHHPADLPAMDGEIVAEYDDPEPEVADGEPEPAPDEPPKRTDGTMVPGQDPDEEAVKTWPLALRQKGVASPYGRRIW